MIVPIDEIVHTLKIYVEQLIDGKNIITLKANDNVCEGERLFEVNIYLHSQDLGQLIFFFTI